MLAVRLSQLGKQELCETLLGRTRGRSGWWLGLLCMCASVRVTVWWPQVMLVVFREGRQTSHCPDACVRSIYSSCCCVAACNVMALGPCCWLLYTQRLV